MSEYYTGLLGSWLGENKPLILDAKQLPQITLTICLFVIISSLRYKGCLAPILAPGNFKAQSDLTGYCLVVAKDYRSGLTDIKLALTAGYPDDLLYKLYERYM